MAELTRLPFVVHLRSVPTAHVRHLSRGRLRHDGLGLAFWLRPLTSAVSEVPTDDRELPLHVTVRTADFQEVTVQGALTYRIVDPAAASARLDFSIDLRSGRWRSAPLEQLATLLSELAQQQALDVVARRPLAEVLTRGTSEVREALETQLADLPRLAETGVRLVGVRVTALRPASELERALQTPARELVQQEADRATSERRAMAVERDRAIQENEMRTQIEMAAQEERLVAQRGANARRHAEDEAAADGIAATAEASRRRALAEADAEAARLVGAAQVETEAARTAVVRDLPPAVLLALAARELAGSLPDIEHLTITPDLLTGALQRLAGGAS